MYAYLLRNLYFLAFFSGLCNLLDSSAYRAPIPIPYRSYQFGQTNLSIGKYPTQIS